MTVEYYPTHVHMLLTWTTYGTWLPGDMRGWRRRRGGQQIPQPLLERWCRAKMHREAVLLDEIHRGCVEMACEEHCRHRSWPLLAANARTNHVHLVLAADSMPGKFRDQLKANCTRALRALSPPLHVPRTWSRGGDCQILDGQEAIEAAVKYVLEGQ